MRTGTRAGIVGAVAGVVGAGAAWAVQDYRRWRALGPGAVPATPAGWLQVGVLRLRARDPLRWRDPGTGEVSRGLTGLPPRPAARPRVAPHPVPHRVLEQAAGAAEILALEAAVDELAARPGLELRTSTWEPHHPALGLPAGTEIGHLHPADGSLHVVLAPLDARVVVARRWGEFHPLAGVAHDLPEGYVLLYPPQDAEQVGHVRAILTAAADHAIDPDPAPPAPEEDRPVASLGLPSVPRRPTS